MKETPPSGLCREEFLDPEGKLDYRQLLLGIQAALQEADPDLVVEPSLQYTVTGDYASTMADLSATMGQDLIPTKSNGAEGLAMTVDASDHDVIVLDAAVIEALFSPLMTTMVHLIHHELGHAHDHAIRRSSGARFLHQEKFSALRLRMFPLAEKLWSEYHAERRSAGTIQGQSQHAPLLVKFMPILVGDISSAIAQYRMHGSIPRLLDEVSARVCALLAFAGYVLGDLAGTRSEPAMLHPDLPGLIATPPLRDLWQPLLEALDELYQSQGCWESSVAFLTLESVLVELYLRLGLKFSERPEGLWVEIQIQG